MVDKLREGAGAPTLAVAKNAGHCDFEIIVQNGDRNAAEEGEGRDMAVQKGFRGLRRIGLDEASVRLRQVETKHMQLHPHAANDADAFAEIDLSDGRAG